MAGGRGRGREAAQAEAGAELGQLSRAFGPRLAATLPGWAVIEGVVRRP